MAAAADAGLIGRLHKRVASLERKNGHLENKVAVHKVTIKQLKGTVRSQRRALNRVSELARIAGRRDDPAEMAQRREAERQRRVAAAQERERAQREAEQEMIRFQREREELQYVKAVYEARMRGDAPPPPPKRTCGVTNFPIPLAADGPQQ